MRRGAGPGIPDGSRSFPIVKERCATDRKEGGREPLRERTMGQNWNSSAEERLIRHARRLLKLALSHTSLKSSPLAYLPALDALRSLDEHLEAPLTRRAKVRHVLDAARHAMRMTWMTSNIRDIPVLSAWFILVLSRIEVRALGGVETILLRPEHARSTGAAGKSSGEAGVATPTCNSF